MDCAKVCVALRQIVTALLLTNIARALHPWRSCVHTTEKKALSVAPTDAKEAIPTITVEYVKYGSILDASQSAGVGDIQEKS
eukprot:1180290-Prorocentrum_minimum.AAC.4